jgi:serine/threonine protein phosphatase 1
MLDFMDRRTSGAGWAKRGGRTTMESYGLKVPLDSTDRAAWSATRSALIHAVPDDHVHFLRNLELVVEFGDVLFVHAGVRPGVALKSQTKRDILWIRSEFIQCEEPFEKLIVHGHTPVERAHVGANRICLDTGAYASGLLSGACFDARSARILEVGGSG